MRERQKQNKRKPSLLSGIATSLVATFLCLLATDRAVEYLLPAPLYQWERRLPFFSEGSVFKNKPWGGFVYEANARIRSRTYYITDLTARRIVEEYAGEIRTNSSGFVQLADLAVARPSIMFLGDSFTEGQGASPWFYELEHHWPKSARYQIVNGGIMGTGFEAWERLFQDTARAVDIRKVVIIFISDDWIRPVFQFSAHQVECLESAARCTGADTYYGLPENPAEADMQLKRIIRARLDYLTRERSGLKVFKGSALYQRLLLPAYHSLWSYRRGKEAMQFGKSRDAILKLASQVGAKNILLIQLPTKGELSSGRYSIGRKGWEFLRREGFALVDGFEQCGLEMADFHVRDGHPNAGGYAKIKQCVERSVRAVFHPL